MSSIEINNTIKTLKKGGVIVYPTDTVWGIGCDATNYNAVQKIFKIKLILFEYIYLKLDYH